MTKIQINSYSNPLHSLLFAACLVFGWEGLADANTPFAPDRTSFAVKVKEETIDYRTMALFVLPKERISIEVSEGRDRDYECATKDGSLTKNSTTKWQWQAPEQAGMYPIAIIQLATADTMNLNVFVMVPFKKVRKGYLNGYRIGNYPSIPLKQLSIYKPPRGFVEVTKENMETLVSPHFKLRQFLCKQGGGFPKYVVLRERLLLKLEFLLERVNELGHRCDTFSVMSGYRTPYYNKAIGNVKYSRHVWGGAADIYIDVDPPDGHMDDLNRDGRIDHEDAAVLYKIIDDMYGKPWFERFVGGLGRYKKTANHGPFVHVDVRGFRARWGM